ncbi:hypothetical protein BpHYR1_047530 [Brachionus plicatilis]|uniref:Uncharacterized protein n=1 Tax=Brachionus plicatilis TaxID=10195 RepID=A0A3M7QVI3_BRAPC|nr:hypothetical protein BpHYR1_047530 [Brachionus plicatilis]
MLLNNFAKLIPVLIENQTIFFLKNFNGCKIKNDIKLSLICYKSGQDLFEFSISCKGGVMMTQAHRGRDEEACKLELMIVCWVQKALVKKVHNYWNDFASFEPFCIKNL